RRIVAERVDVRAGRRDDAELLLQVALSVERLPHERFATGDVAVRLDPPAADDLEAPGVDVRADSLEQLRIALLHPGEEERGVAGEDELGKLVEPVDGGVEGGANFLVALGPLPQPHRIDVGVADHVQAPQLLAAHRSTSSRITCRSRTCISWMRAVESEGTASTRSASPPSCPVKRIVTAPSSRAAARPRTTFAERPLVEKPITTSPSRTKPRTWRSNTSSYE